MKKERNAVFREEKPEKERPAVFIYEAVSVIVTAVVIILIIFAFFGRLSGVVGHSMNPTLEDGDWTIMGQMGSEYVPEYGDIVVVSQPNALNEVLIKRVIATGGQTIDIDFDTGEVKVDGQILDEPYIAEPTYYHFDDGIYFPYKVPKGYVFVMGDNRNNSTDSRSAMVGPIKNEYLLGKVSYSLGTGGMQHFE